MRRLVMLVAAAILAVGCGDPNMTGSADGPAPPAGAGDLPMCEELDEVQPPSEHLATEPIYVANEQPLEELAAWASTQPAFEELWIDRDNLGWVVLAFSADADARQSDLREQFPDVGAVAVAVDWTLDELLDLQSQIPSDLGFSSSADIKRGVVEIMVGPLTDEAVAAVESRFAGERVCISGSDPADLPEPGDQAQRGEGWRLLADELTGESYRTGIAADEAGYERLWSEIGLAGDRPAVDWETEVAMWFGAVYSGSCPDIRFDGITVDPEASLVHAQIVDLHAGMACTADANPRAYVVAVERSVLPEGPFALQLGETDPPPGAPEERIIVAADLSQPGAALPEAQPGTDPDRVDPPGYVAEAGGIIEPGFPTDFRVYLHCGPEWVGPVNSILWRSEVTDTPAAWRELISETDETLIAEALLDVEAQTLTLTANDHAIVYVATAEEHPGCD